MSDVKRVAVFVCVFVLWIAGLAILPQYMSRDLMAAWSVVGALLVIGALALAIRYDETLREG